MYCMLTHKFTSHHISTLFGGIHNTVFFLSEKSNFFLNHTFYSHKCTMFCPVYLFLWNFYFFIRVFFHNSPRLWNAHFSSKSFDFCIHSYHIQNGGRVLFFFFFFADVFPTTFPFNILSATSFKLMLGYRGQSHELYKTFYRFSTSHFYWLVHRQPCWYSG